ncbi:MAG: SDR family oxidoreductase [Pseudomonadota bacterium]
MDIKEKIIVVTGGASGIGAAMATRFAAEHARHVVVADLNGTQAEDVAAAINTGAADHGCAATAATLDVTDEAALLALIEQTEAEIGPIDLFCSNAGVGIGEGLDTQNETWQTIWEINTMAHVYAARHMVPRMKQRGGGYLLNTASAAGLLSQIGSVTYAVTKHAAVALAEWIAITHGRDGIKVSVLCPQAVRTPMTAGGPGVAAVDGMIEADVVAEEVVNTLAEERFLVLPHKEVGEYIKRKTSDYDRWLQGMQRLQERYLVD